jgi:hypothetical protein
MTSRIPGNRSVTPRIPVVKNFFKGGKGGPFIIGGGLYVWLFRERDVQGEQSTVLFKVEKGLVVEGWMRLDTTHEFRTQVEAMALFNESRQMIQKLVRIQKEVTVWPDTVI